MINGNKRSTEKKTVGLVVQYFIVPADKYPEKYQFSIINIMKIPNVQSDLRLEKYVYTLEYTGPVLVNDMQTPPLPSPPAQKEPFPYV